MGVGFKLKEKLEGKSIEYYKQYKFWLRSAIDSLTRLQDELNDFLIKWDIAEKFLSDEGEKDNSKVSEVFLKECFKSTQDTIKKLPTESDERLTEEQKNVLKNTEVIMFKITKAKEYLVSLPGKLNELIALKDRCLNDYDNFTRGCIGFLKIAGFFQENIFDQDANLTNEWNEIVHRREERDCARQIQELLIQIVEKNQEKIKDLLSKESAESLIDVEKYLQDLTQIKTQAREIYREIDKILSEIRVRMYNLNAFIYKLDESLEASTTSNSSSYVDVKPNEFKGLGYVPAEINLDAILAVLANDLGK